MHNIFLLTFLEKHIFGDKKANCRLRGLLAQVQHVFVTGVTNPRSSHEKISIYQATKKKHTENRNLI